MRGFYTEYGDAIYELPEDGMKIRNTFPFAKDTHVDVSHAENTKTTNVVISISTIDKNAMSNREAYEQMVDKLKTDEVTSIRKMSPGCRIYVEYRLFDDSIQEVVDEGVAIKNCNTDAFLFLLGLDDTNELVSRIGIDFGATISKRYHSTVPYGLMRTAVDHFTLYIDRIYVTQFYASVFSVKPAPERPPKKPRPWFMGNRPCPYGDKHGNHHPDDGYMMDPIHHPSMASTTRDEICTVKPKSEDAIIIYDTSAVGITFEPVKIPYRLKELRLSIGFLLMNVVTASKEDIANILRENVEQEMNPGEVPDEKEPGDDKEPIVPEPDDNTEEVEPTPPEDITTGGGEDLPDTESGDADKEETGDENGDVTSPQ